MCLTFKEETLKLYQKDNNAKLYHNYYPSLTTDRKGCTMMRIIGYIVALAVGLAAVIAGISGTAQGKISILFVPCWILLGAGLGWLAVSIWRIIKGGEASVELRDDPGILAILTMPIWPDGVIAIGMIVIGLVVVYGVYALANWPH